ncbi:hypothetical protein OH77DRAFT_1572366 [Trametes cingulata]|nr:hypothetical protein OH77DRAFT_1572366 [Trametes cingulata]
MFIRDLAQLVHETSLFGDISTDDFLRFIRLCKLVRPAVELTLRDNRQPPPRLPEHVHEFLAASLCKSYTEIAWYWCAFRHAAWTSSSMAPTREDIESFRAHGLSRGIGAVCLERTCVNHRPSDEIMTLTEPLSYRATLFTLREGALPVYTTSLYCHACHRRYHPNYYVDNAGSLRTFYEGPPPTVLQVSTHFFIEAAVLELFGNGMMFGWLSANNCARLYNAALARVDAHIHNNPLAYGTSACYPAFKQEWPYSLELQAEEAMNGFFLYSLLLDRAEHKSHLVLSHNSTTQKDRLAEALRNRNEAMEGIGQEEWAHACDLCFVIKEGTDGELRKVQYAVGDGLAIGRPCCAVHDCKVDLASKRDIYCPKHAILAHKCAVLDCDRPHLSGRQTCERKDHQAVEDAYIKDHTRAIHQLRARLRSNGVSVPGDATTQDC